MSQVNDFAFKIATANGTGSASANGLIMQAIFRMGVPVTGKNVFPSNIQGLPTWYEMRVSKDGYTARTPIFDLMVALNPATYAKDVAEVRPGGDKRHDLDVHGREPAPLSGVVVDIGRGPARPHVVGPEADLVVVAPAVAVLGPVEHRRRRVAD